PLDREALRAQKDKKLFVTVEEHRKDGGLGTAVAEVMAEEGGYPKLLRLGVDADYKHAGTYAFMLEQNRLTPELIAADIQQVFGSQVE
ncbi:MAG: transketolase, partial [Clostridia bacterium]|nr:transketolase [Clostridia bacterium]